MSGIERVVHEVKIAKCVASNSSADRLRNSLGRTSLWGDFHPYIYSADIVRRPKPAPDLIEHCLGVFGVEGNRAIVIDDSESGVRAARSAGARAIGFIDPSDPRPSRESALLDAGAEMVATGADALLAKLRPLLDDAHG
jgi:beta-phosphoglucomutase-like phosphatase (HAD superfamily)